jgi:hypothetical protein
MKNLNITIGGADVNQNVVNEAIQDDSSAVTYSKTTDGFLGFQGGIHE